MKISLSIKPDKETEKIVGFLKRVQRKTKIDKVVIGMSGGVDSTTVFYLLKRTYAPENIYPAILNYYPKDNSLIKKALYEAGVPKTNILDLSIKPMVEEIEKRLSADRTRKGNIMARVRMIVLFDLAKSVGALVCGTENKSERLLGYFTRYGDAASDIEPMGNLYKTQVYQLAEFLGVPKQILKVPPTAGLWENQTDEKEFGFSYREADQVLHLFVDRKVKSEKIQKIGYKKAKKILERVASNQFKQKVPYIFTG
jgi:NAD+ synthase